MILPVVFSATAVQSLMTYLEWCMFPANTNCAESEYSGCVNTTADESSTDDSDDGGLEGLSCDAMMVYVQEDRPELESWDTCITVSDYDEDTEEYYQYDMTATCNDDGRSVCDGAIVCTEICQFSSTGTCDGFCYEVNYPIPGMNDCDDYRANYTAMDVGFTNFGECFLFNDTIDVRITGCPNYIPNLSPSSTNDMNIAPSSTNDMNIGLIVGLTGAVLLIIIAILVFVNYRKSQKKAENLQKTIDAA